jgi:hypothetical protein
MGALNPIVRHLIEADDDEWQDIHKDVGQGPIEVQVDLGGILWSPTEDEWLRHDPQSYALMKQLWDYGTPFKVISRPTHQAGVDANKMDVSVDPEKRKATVDCWFTWDAHDTVIRDIYGVAADDEELEVFDEIQMAVEQWMTEHDFVEDGHFHSFHITRTIEADYFDRFLYRVNDLENNLINVETAMADEFSRWKDQLRRERGLAESEEDEDFDAKELDTGPVEFKLVDGWGGGWNATSITDAIYRAGQIEYQNDYRGKWWDISYIEIEGKNYPGTRSGLRRFERDVLRAGPDARIRATIMVHDGGYQPGHWTVLPVLRS